MICRSNRGFDPRCESPLQPILDRAVPISHKHKTIFIHVPRTGGSSIEKALGIYGRNNDGANECCIEILFGLSSTIYLQHLTILEIQDRMTKDPGGKDLFREYFKFAFIRNPYDRIISEYFYSEEVKNLNLMELLTDVTHSGKSRAKILYRARYDNHTFMGQWKRLSFREFLLNVALPNKDKSIDKDLDRHFKNQRTFLTDRKGKLMVDFVGRFENLEEDFGKICSRFGLKGELSKINRTRHRNYAHYYDDETRRLVHDLYREDIEAFGYSF